MLLDIGLARARVGAVGVFAFNPYSVLVVAVSPVPITIFLGGETLDVVFAGLLGAFVRTVVGLLMLPMIRLAKVKQAESKSIPKITLTAEGLLALRARILLIGANPEVLSFWGANGLSRGCPS